MVMRTRIWLHRVEAAFAERLAAQKPPKGHSSAPHQSIFTHCNGRVLRAGGLKAACSGRTRYGVQRGRNRVLVHAMQSRDGPLPDTHACAPILPAWAASACAEIDENTFATSRSNRANSNSSTTLRGCSTTSANGGSRSRLTRAASL